MLRGTAAVFLLTIAPLIANNEFMEHWNRLPVELQVMIMEYVGEVRLPFSLCKKAYATIKPCWKVPDVVHTVRLSCSSKYVITTESSRGEISIYEIDSGACKGTLRNHSYRFLDATMSNDDRLIATFSSEGQIEIWDWRIGQRIEALPSPVGANNRSYRPKSLAYSPCGERLAVWGKRNGEYKSWVINLWDSNHVCNKWLTIASGYDGVPYIAPRIDFSTDGRMIMVHSPSLSFKNMFELASGRSIPISNAGYRYSPYPILVLNNRYQIRKNELWDASRNNVVVGEFPIKTHFLQAFITPDNRYIVAQLKGGYVHVYDLYAPINNLCSKSSPEELCALESLLRYFYEKCIENRPYSYEEIIPGGKKQFDSLLTKYTPAVRSLLEDKYQLFEQSTNDPHEQKRARTK